ncbi:MAG TPA: hypothetical protein VJW17_15730 [Pyrinomonadaceae bacterium]|nr:hypothetical protein [Pyrinomonadaceae bacterium]
MIRLIAVNFTILFFLGLVAHAAQDGPTFDSRQVPAEGRKPQDFVPVGWRIGVSAAGDLNGDQIPDQVLQIVPSNNYDTSGVPAAPDSQAMLILLSDHGGLRRAALSTKLLATMVPQYILDIGIKNGVVVIHQNFGMTEVTDLTHRFRLEPTAHRFQLIGKDTFYYHRPQGPRWPATRVSENYLTGIRLTATDHWLNDETNRPRTKRGQVARARLFLEEINVSSRY